VLYKAYYTMLYCTILVTIQYYTMLYCILHTILYYALPSYIRLRGAVKSLVITLCLQQR